MLYIPFSSAEQYVGADGGSSGLCLGDTLPRVCINFNTMPVTSGVLSLNALYLPAGTPVTALGIVTGTTPAITPTHFWLALYDKNRNQLCNTADQGATAIPATTEFQLPVVGGQFVTTYSGLYYLGIMVVAATTPTFMGQAQSGVAYTGIPPILCGTSDVGQTTPPVLPHQAIAITPGNNSHYLWAS